MASLNCDDSSLSSVTDATSSESHSDCGDSSDNDVTDATYLHEECRELFSSTHSADGPTSEDDFFRRVTEWEDSNSNSSPQYSSDVLENSDSDSDIRSFKQYKRPRIELEEEQAFVQHQPDENVLHEDFEENINQNTQIDSNERSDSDGPSDNLSEHVQHNDSEISHCSSSSRLSSSSESSPTSDSEVSLPDMQDPAAMPAFNGSSATRSSFEATFLALSKKHKFSKSTRQDLLKFLGIVLPNPNLPSSNYSFDQDIWRAIGLSYEKYEFCPSCNHLLVLKTRICEYEHCEYLNTVPSVQPTECFFIIPVAAQLKRILEENWLLISKYKADHRHDGTTYRDICCGELYQQNNECDDPTRLISLIFHTDGAPAVKSKTLGLWPIQSILVELPPTIRYSFKNVLFSGLWCGTKKPNLQMFQQYFVDQVKEINAASGLELNLRATTQRVQIKLVNVHGHIADLVAKAPSLNFRQFNGHFGCSICLHPGERIAKGRGTVQVYPVYDDIPERRNHLDTIKQARLAETSKKALFGILGTSPLHDVLRIPDSLILDYMHLVLEGEFVRRLSIWMNGQDENGCLAKVLAPLEAAMMKIEFPHDFNRKLRPFRNFKRWKDREVQNFFLHASLPLLKDLLPPNLFYHLSIFVTAIWLLIDNVVTAEDVDVARILLVHYGRLVESIYGKSEVTYTVHALQHLPEQVKNFGPLILHSGFVFEAMISHLKRLFHGTRCIPEQIVKNLLIAQNTNAFIEESTSGVNEGNEELCAFAKQLSHQKTTSCQDYGDGISLVGEVKRCVKLQPLVLRALQQHFGNEIETSVMEASRMKKHNQVFHSIAYRRKGKSCSYLVQYGSHESLHILKYGKVLSYLVVSGVPYAVVECFQHGSRSIMSGLPEPEDELVKSFNERGLLGKPFVSVDDGNEVEIIPCKNILRRCIFIRSSENEDDDEEDCHGYLCPVLKNYEHD